MSYYTSVIVLVLLALGVLSVLVAENDRIPRRKKDLFIITNILIAASAVTECAGIHLCGKADIPSGALMAAKTLDYILTPLTGGALIALMRKPGSRSGAIQWLFIANTVFQIISAFTGWMTVIDAENYYTHGPLYPVYMVFYLAVLVILAVVLISYGKSFRKQNRLSLYATVILIFVGIIMQEVFGSEHRVVYIALTFGAAYLFIHYSEFSQLEMDDQITEQQVKITIDPLTGVNSRFAYVDAVNGYASGIPDGLAVFMFDVNGLKSANDTLGHEAGDEMIRGSARCIESTVGKGIKTYRIGGDEFVVFAEMTRQQADAALAALEAETGKWSGNKVKKLSISAGYALASEHEGISAEALVKEADRAMYEKKRDYYRKNGIDRRKSSAATSEQ